MLDFTALPTRNKFYAGANGAKIAVIYDGEQYMLKFPAPAPKNKELSYANSCISEYIGCHIFNSVGIAAQETLLGIYRKNGAEKIVVACKDFTSPGIVLQDFASLKNTVINSGHSGYGTELSDITQAMEDQTAFPPALLKQHFWDMFIVDALIGNRIDLLPAECHLHFSHNIDNSPMGTAIKYHQSFSRLKNHTLLMCKIICNKLFTDFPVHVRPASHLIQTAGKMRHDPDAFFNFTDCI